MTGYDSSNIFARIIRGEIPAKKLFETEHTLVFHDIAPKAPTHLLVIPKGTYVTLDELLVKGSEPEILDFNRSIARAIDEAGLAGSGYRIVSNNGAHGGQEVPHFHVHIVGGKMLGNPFGAL